MNSEFCIQAGRPAGPIKVVKNNSNDTIKLISRHWKIFDSNGSYREVKGKGVVGEQPVIHPGHEFEYTSGTPLKTSSGLMHGSYQMEDFKGKPFEVLIPPFSLDVPNNNVKLNQLVIDNLKSSFFVIGNLLIFFSIYSLIPGLFHYYLNGSDWVVFFVISIVCFFTGLNISFTFKKKN